jgi:hypothetical protein
MSDLLKDLGKTLSDEAKAVLSPEPLQEDVSEDGVLGKLIGTIENINTAFNLMSVEITQIKQRVESLEKYVSFLLSKDSQFMEAFKKAEEKVSKKE